jgi:hypothetical protein
VGGNGLEKYFTDEFIYISLWSLNGCTIRITATFRKEDLSLINKEDKDDF